jgi:carbamoyl-phosphate synthase large subunit
MIQNILFTCAGRRNYLINYFKEALNGNGKILAADQDVTAPAMVDADKAVKVPSIYSKSYITELMNVIKENKITAVISLNDLELPILSQNKDLLEETGAKILVSDQNAIDTSFDKWKTHEFIERIGLKSPKTYKTLHSALNALSQGNLQFPLVVKPRWGSASISIDFAENLKELQLIYELQKIKISRSILKHASDDNLNESIIIQEKIPGKEYGMDIVNDFDKNYFGSFVREKVSMRSGETDKAISVIKPVLNEIGRTIAENIRHIGNMDCDLFEHENDTYVLELNPRFGGGYPFSHEAGINTAAIYVKWLNEDKNINSHNNYKAGVFFSKCDRLIEIKN